MVKYFLVSRDNNEKIHSTIMSDMIDEQNMLHEETKKLELEEEIYLSPDKQQRFQETKQEIYRQRDDALDRLKLFSLRDMSDEIDRMKLEGYFEDGDDLVDKDMNDPQFREAVNEAVREVLLRQYMAEHNVRIKTLEEIRNAVEILREEEKQKGAAKIKIFAAS